jgi:hypothetical protein
MRHVPGRHVLEDVRARLPHYHADWRDALTEGALLVPPTVYIFLASALPALAFGAQLEELTDGALSIPQVLASTAAAGSVQALLGGQPLLIIGVAEPIVVMYGFMYTLVRDDAAIGPRLFRAWAAWVCVWTALLVAALALAGATRAIRYFTRFAGELFGMLIAVLFLQQAVVGTRDEFSGAYGGAVNGLWAVITVIGLPCTALALRGARSWRVATPRVRAVLGDYAAPIMVLAWTALSYALPARGLTGVPRRVAARQPWARGSGGWGVVGDMGRIPGSAKALALGPALAITVLFYFDHTVSSQLAQTGDLKLVRPPAYAYDLLLLAAMTLAAGLLGIPPVNGVLPQAPMHARALRGLRAPDAPIAEQRMSNLAQALLVGALLPAAPAIALLPTCVLWGYFAFMALESLPGSQLASRVVLLATDPALRPAVLAREAPPYAHVPMRTIAVFTALQAAALAGVWALIAFGGVGGIAFPLPILALLPLRALLLPRLLGQAAVRALDEAEYEQDGDAAAAAEAVRTNGAAPVEAELVDIPECVEAANGAAGHALDERRDDAPP